MENDKILIIEDNPDNVAILSLFLESEGCEIFVASNGTKGIQRAELTQPDIILLDILMPGIDGYETCRQLKKNELTKNIPVIFLSALSETFDKVEAFSCGGVDYVTKPIQAEELLARVNTHLDIRRMQKELLAHNHNLEYLVKQRTEELEKTNHELLRAKEKAEEGNKLKTAFLQNISHEVRTPLNGIMGFTELLCNIESSNEKIAFYADFIRNSSLQLMRIIEDILMVSRIESNQVEITTNQTEINYVLHTVYDEFQSIAISKKINFALDTDPKLTTFATLSENLLKQIISKLIDNALKFTHSGKVNFGYRILDNELEFYVSDTGIGIEQKDFELIFEPFRQLDYSESRNYGGTGIGLTISKALVSKMGGRIWLESVKNVGTTFYFTIPYISSGINETPWAADTNISRYKGNSILVVDDVESNYQLVYEKLTMLNLNVYYAMDGNEAINVFTSAPKIDLILMDIKMPGINGYEAAQAIRRLDNNVPIIAFSAYDLDEEIMNGNEKLFNGILNKPVDFKYFEKTISQHLHTN